MPRLAHSKSRLGCKRCKQRKVKCDEVRPSCRACLRHNVPCDYPKMFVKLREQYSPSQPDRPSAEHVEIRPSPWPRDSASGHMGTNNDVSGGNSAGISSADYPSSQLSQQQQQAHGARWEGSNDSGAEVENRRRFEMQLIHHFTLYTSRTFAPYGETLWTVTAPELAFEHGFLLDEILGFTALHLARQKNDSDCLTASHHYFDRAVQSHAEHVRHLHAGNYEAAVVASLLISLHAFALMAVHDCGPPSTCRLRAWFRMTSRGKELVRRCYPWTLTSERLRPVVTHLDKTDSESRMAPPTTAGTPFGGLLRFDDDSEQPTDEDMIAYERGLAYIGALHNMVSSGRENSTALAVRLLGLPATCPPRFAALVEEQRPRAMVLLAHAFAVALMIPSDKWWARGVYGLQITAIHNSIPRAWAHLMAWPLEISRTYQEH